MSSFKEYFDKLDSKGKSEFSERITEKFNGKVSPSTIHNWKRPIAPTTPSADVCEWVAEYFGTTPENIFPFYILKVNQKERGVRQLPNVALSQR